jgi:hypothetical protein
LGGFIFILSKQILVLPYSNVIHLCLQPHYVLY